MDSPPLNSQFLPHGTRIDEFVIERILRSDGFVDTYLARDEALGRQVVIKECMPKEFCARDPSSLMVFPRQGVVHAAENFRWLLGNFAKEAKTFAGMRHRGVSGVLRFFEAYGTGYYVLPHVDGVSLGMLVKQRGGELFAEDELCGWLVRILEVLEYLHERDIYHWDIKLESILVTHEGVPMLGDFGAAWHWQGERAVVVESGAEDPLFGNFQTRGALGTWYDIYALGATLVMLMTGEGAPKSHARSVGDSWVPLSGRGELEGRYSEGFLEGIDKALSLPNEACWQSAGEWCAAVRGALFGKTAVVKTAVVKTAEPVVREAELAESKRGKRWPWVVAAVVLLLGGALGFFSLQPREVGGLVISSEPAGAELRDGAGMLVGTTPVELGNLAAGLLWQGVLALEGYFPEKVVIEVNARETRAMPVFMLRPVGLPQVNVAVDPPRVEVLEVVPLKSLEGTRAGEERDFEIAPGVVMTFCWCPPGKFMMGSPEDELGREADEERVEVTLSKGFWLAKTEVTHDQWMAAGGADVGDLPPAFWEGEVRYTWEQMSEQGLDPANFRGGNLPVERVEWDKAWDWCLGLAERLRDAGQLTVGWEVVLPTEAQWEYACRAGVTTAFHHGRNLRSKVGVCGNLDEVGWYDQNSKNGTQAVGMKKANAWGLHDMHGNVWEWCADWYEPELGGGRDPRGADSGVYRAYRGGSWRNTAAYCRAAFRYRDKPDGRFINLGLRPALVFAE